MVGLSVVLEGSYKGKNKKGPQVINKYSKMIKPSSSSSSSNNPPIFSGKRSSDFPRFAATNDFLQCCFLCKQKLLAGKDIYMYKGDRAFCSKECRCRQILMDEEEETLNNANANATAARFSLRAAPNCHNNGSGNRANSSAFSYNI